MSVKTVTRVLAADNVTLNIPYLTITESNSNKNGPEGDESHLQRQPLKWWELTRMATTHEIEAKRKPGGTSGCSSNATVNSVIAVDGRKLSAKDIKHLLS